MTAPLLRTTKLATAYRRFLSTGDSPSFAAAVDESYSISTLASLLIRGDIEIRRAAALSLGILGDSNSVEPLGQAICDTDRGVRMAADDSFRALLVRNAAPVHHQKLLQIMHLTDGGEFAGALAPTMILLDQAPNFVEAHHQLAVCWHGLADFQQAESAYSACLWHCRYHYPAWQGLARCRAVLGDIPGALSALQRSIGVCPDLESARAQMRVLEKQLREANE